MPPTNSSHQGARQDPKYRTLAEMSNYGIEAFLLTAQLQWTGHVVRMDNSHLPWMIFCGQLQQGERSRGGQRKRYKDALKANLTMLDINPAHLESLTTDRTSWRALCRQSIGSFEDSRVSHAENERRLRKTGHASTSTSSTVQCDVCGRTCGSRIGLFSHKRTHYMIRDLSCRRLSPSQYLVRTSN